MEFEKFGGSHRGKKSRSYPSVKIWSSGKLAFNQRAVEEWLHDADFVELFTRADVDGDDGSGTNAMKIGIAPATEDDSDVYSLHTTETYNGKLLQMRALLRLFDIVRPDSSMRLDAYYDSKRQMVIVDLDELR